MNNKILDNIIKASESSGFHVSEDIYDQSDNKLLAKGNAVSSAIRQKLFNRILKKPLETCLSSDNAITSEDISNAAKMLIKNNSLLNLISPNIEDEAKALVNLKIDPLASILLTVMKDSHPNKLNHSLFVALIARSVATNMNLSHQEITNLTLSSILHDVGELYSPIPETKALTENDWRQIMAHPVIGSAIVEQYMNYPVEVSATILEHHERCDGTGYPKKIKANDCSTNGQILILILSEAIAGILQSGVEAQNISILFKMSSGVYPTKPLNAFNNMLKSLSYTRSEVNKDSTMDHLQLKITTLNDVSLKVENLLKNNDIPVLIEENATHLKFRLEKLKQSIYSSGIQYYLDEKSWITSDDSQVILLELKILTNEVGWQIQDMLRDITLRLVDFEHHLPKEFSEITEQLAQLNKKY